MLDKSGSAILASTEIMKVGVHMKKVTFFKVTVIPKACFKTL